MTLGNFQVPAQLLKVSFNAVWKYFFIDNRVGALALSARFASRSPTEKRQGLNLVLFFRNCTELLDISAYQCSIRPYWLNCIEKPGRIR